ncbi:hypothetical protein J2129_001541 [Methanofollis sp. W23]|nr:hypothetical protein [Methanofollis sp. W23]
MTAPKAMRGSRVIANQTMIAGATETAA